MSSTINFIGIICRSNTSQFSVITVVINLWKTLPNTVKMMSSYMSFKKYIKSIFLNVFVYGHVCIYEADAKAHGNLLNKGKQHTNLYT